MQQPKTPHAPSPAQMMQCITQHIVKTSVLYLQMLMDLGPVVYVEDFEKHFLAKAAEFYQVRGILMTPQLQSN